MIGGFLPYALGAAASAATLLGGTITLRFSKRLNLIMGLSAGIVLGVALFDLIPEALNLVDDERGPRYVLSAVALGLSAYLILDRCLPALFASGEHVRRQIGPTSLTLHSLMDGAGIGLAFQLSSEVGWSVAFAVLSHDIADGVNIVSLSLNADNDRSARRWLVANAAAPLIGVAAGQLVAVSSAVLVPVMAALAGMFLYIGASELLTKSYRMDHRIGTTGASVLGFALVYVITQFHG